MSMLMVVFVLQKGTGSLVLLGRLTFRTQIVWQAAVIRTLAFFEALSFLACEGRKLRASQFLWCGTCGLVHVSRPHERSLLLRCCRGQNHQGVSLNFMSVIQFTDVVSSLDHSLFKICYWCLDRICHFAALQTSCMQWYLCSKVEVSNQQSGFLVERSSR